MSILTHFPYDEPRDGQREVLTAIEKYYDSYDVFVVVAPTAAGKSAIMQTLQKWKYAASAITPTNMLVDQYLAEFPGTPTMQRMDKYYCEEWQRPCSVTRAKMRGFCKGCECSKALAAAKYRNGPGIYNYHIYLAHQIHRPLLIIDEAHNITRAIQDRQSTQIWRHDYKYELSMYKPDQIRRWIEKLPANKQKHKKIAQLHDAVTSTRPNFVIQRTEDEFNGKGTVRGKPELRDCIKLYPVDISQAPPAFWPRDVQKIVLLSATIGPVDIAELGLASRRVLYLHAASPIPAIRRPVKLLDTAHLSYQNMHIEEITNEIIGISNYHAGEKGIIHATYELAEALRGNLQHGDRFFFHNRENKRDIYQRFRDSTDSPVLVASGMYEGIDLPDDLGRWQVIAKTPWKSLADPAIAYKAKQDPDWYTWQCLKDFIQACGRVCRHEEDEGITYVTDSTINKLLEDGAHLIPEWFNQALAAGRRV